MYQAQFILAFSFNTGKRDGQADGKKTWTPDTPQRVMKAETARKNMPEWPCGQIVNGGTCGWCNFYSSAPSGTAFT